MQSTALLAVAGLMAAAISTPLLAGDPGHATEKHATKKGTADGFDHGMKAVVHDAAADTPGYGWRYFSDPAAHRAVVISPQGNYYYSRGKGLHWIAAELT